MTAKIAKLELYSSAVAMMANGTSIVDVAKSLGISRTALFNWRQDPVFRQMHDNLCKGAVEFARAELKQLSLEAVEAIRDCLKKKQNSKEIKVNQGRRQAAESVFKAIGLYEHVSNMEEMSDEQLSTLITDLGLKQVEAEAN